MGLIKTQALMWRIEREDGQVFGVTDHDEDIEIDGLKYLAQGAFDPSQLESKLGISPDNCEIMGAAQSDVFRFEDLRSGLYDDAQVEYFLWDWNKGERAETIFAGRICQLDFSQNQVRAELQNDIDKIDSVFGQSFHPECSAQFCDRACGLDGEKFSQETRLIKCDMKKLVVEGDAWPWPIVNGWVEVLGAPEKLKRLAIRNAKTMNHETHIELWQIPKFKLRSSVRVRICAGCDKRFETCRNSFGNAVNFRGFPHLPGDAILNKNAAKT